MTPTSTPALDKPALRFDGRPVRPSVDGPRVPPGGLDVSMDLLREPEVSPRRRRTQPEHRFSIMPGERAFLIESLADLTPRELDVLFEICEGGTNDAAAERLCIALPTLRSHLMRLHRKLGTSRKSDLVGLVACRLLEGYRSGGINV